MESFFSSLKTERTTRKVYRTRDDARADVFDYIERFYNPRRRHSTLGYMGPASSRRKLCQPNLVSENRQQAICRWARLGWSRYVFDVQGRSRLGSWPATSRRATCRGEFDSILIAGTP
jgi:hypothetical protein